jgi:hypothetical protein
MIEITLVIPGLRLLDSNQIKRDMPSLHRLISRGTRVDSQANEQQLLDHLLQCPVTEYQAPLCALSHGLAATEGWWLQVEPIEIQADQNSAYVLGNRHLAITQAEAQALVTSFNTFLQQDQLELILGNETQWYLRLSEPPGIKTHSLSAALAKNLYDYLPTGERQEYWRRLLTELQMLLYQMPLYQQRHSVGQSLINGLWFSGEGQLPKVVPKSCWSTLCSNAPLLQGYAAWLKQLVIPATSSFENYAHSLFPGCHLWLLEDFMRAEVYCDEAEKKHLLKQLEDNLFTPLLTALKHNQVAKVNLYCATDQWILNSSRFKPWWRRVM